MPITPHDSIAHDPVVHDPVVEHYRHQAKHLHKAVQAGSGAAAQRVASHLPRLRNAPAADVIDGDVGLQECQHVVARENGYTKWAVLVDPETPRFEDIVQLSDAEIGVLLRDVGPQDMALALLGLTQAPVSRRHHAVLGMLAQLPNDVHDELRAQAVDLTLDADAIADAQERIARQVGKLKQAGQIPHRAQKSTREPPAPVDVSGDLAVWNRCLETASLDQIRAGLLALGAAHESGVLEGTLAGAGQSYAWHGVRLVVDGTEVSMIRHLLGHQLRTALRQVEIRWRMAIEATASMAWGDNPRIIQHKLAALYSTEQQPAYRDTEGTLSQAVERLQRTAATSMTLHEINELYTDIAWAACISCAVRADGLVALSEIADAMDDELMAEGLRLIADRVGGTTRTPDEALGQTIQRIVDEMETSVASRLAQVKLRYRLVEEGIVALAEGESVEQLTSRLDAVQVEDEVRAVS